MIGGRVNWPQRTSGGQFRRYLSEAENYVH